MLNDSTFLWFVIFPLVGVLGCLKVRWATEALNEGCRTQKRRALQTESKTFDLQETVRQLKTLLS